jgi:hypothetical protein
MASKVTPPKLLINNTNADIKDTIDTVAGQVETQEPNQPGGGQGVVTHPNANTHKGIQQMSQFRKDTLSTQTCPYCSCNRIKRLLFDSAANTIHRAVERLNAPKKDLPHNL